MSDNSGRLWHNSSEELPAGEELIVVHGPTFSIGRKHEFDAIGLSVDAWCTRNELIASARAFVSPAAPRAARVDDGLPTFRTTKEAMLYAQRNNIPAVVPVSFSLSQPARAAAEEIREWIGISGLVDGEGLNEVAAIVSRHFPSPPVAEDARCSECGHKYCSLCMVSCCECDADFPPTATSGSNDAWELVDEVQRRMDQVVEAAVEWHQAGREGAKWFDKAETLSAAIDSLLELRSKPGECFCGTELEAGLCPSGHDPITSHASIPSLSTTNVLLDARKVAFDWVTDRELYGINNDEIEALAQRITTLADQRYVEGLRAAAKAVGSVFKAAHTYTSENADDYHYFDDGQRYAINNALAAIRTLLNTEKKNDRNEV